MMMQTTHFWYLPHETEFWRVHGPRERSVHVQRSMRPKMVVIRKVAGQEACEMPLMEDDDVVQTLPTDAPDQAFDIGILPWRPWSDDDFLDAHVLDTLPKGCAVDGVPIAQEIARRFLPGEGVNDLLRRPLRRWVLGDIVKWSTRRRSWAMMSSTKRTLYVTVGTTKKSSATSSCT